ncbi:hypothetical protein WJ74_10960 [Burkholderia ubonensis]|uniref:hypothetical protein n=1 Tax=Burkholderia ubonensis TaxID=101571 RepID=UPI0007521B8A|nr:hypothetical protein [Burkholderia ubonensis]KVO15237.1 hypothetical protein WJ74_10960 [Burkholderia ubonensis]
MKKFCLLCPGLRTAIPDDLLGKLRSLPGVQLDRVTSGIVSVWFDGNETELRTLLGETDWSALDVRISESRLYRVK